MTHHSEDNERRSLIESYEGWDFVEVALNPNTASRVIADLASRLDIALRSSEPSDAQVEAAIQAWNANDEEYGDVAMRAALRAAGRLQ